MRIIGLMGAAGSGKSTAATYLLTRYGATIYSLAGPLKELVKRAFELSHEQVWGTQAEKEAVDPRYNVSPRWLLQRIGTEGCRAVLGKDVWTDALIGKIEDDQPVVAVIEDVRFVNEAERILDAGGEVWRLEVDGGDLPNGACHVSEQEWVHAPYSRRIVSKITPGSTDLKSRIEEAFGWAR